MEQSYLFLSGADMEPTALRRALPAGQFVARGRIDARAGEIRPPFHEWIAKPGTGEVWGIVIAVPGVHTTPYARTITTDDGRQFDGWLVGDFVCDGEPEATLAAARYWELPPSYVIRLMRALNVDITAE